MRHFGIDEANALIPVLTRTFEGVRLLAVELEDAEGADRDALAARIQHELQPLVDAGIEVKALDGLVDFRALREGRTVYLCWRWGEERITHWHELETGFSGRRRIKAGDAFERTYLS